MSGRNKRPSKFTPVESTKLRDLIEHSNASPIPEETLLSLSEDDTVKLVFVNRGYVWVHVKTVDHEDGTGMKPGA